VETATKRTENRLVAPVTDRPNSDINNLRAIFGLATSKPVRKSKINQSEIKQVAEKAKVNGLSLGLCYIDELRANSLQDNGVALLRAAVAFVYGVETLAFFDFVGLKANALVSQR
jgi:hypothetical protein